jgi:hypothetical protein
VGDARLRKLAADRESGLTGTNDHDVDLVGHRTAEFMRRDAAPLA